MAVWYLGALMILYALLPVLFRFKHILKLLWTVCLVVGFVFQIASYICGEPVQKHFIQIFRLWTWVQYFVLGWLLAGSETAQEKITMRQHGLILIILTGLVVVYQNFIGRFDLRNLYAKYFYDDILTVVWVITLFTFVMRLNLKDRSVAVIKQIASITMGVYIVHPLFLLVRNAVFIIDTIPEPLLYFVSILFLSVAVCFVMKHISGIKRLIEI
ncbi:acyltransferase family protein [Enterocloster clostridioformis]|nr:acyltransferase family protein [Enterocloster clostridioformis]